jgi:hypothetical protein
MLSAKVFWKPETFKVLETLNLQGFGNPKPSRFWKPETFKVLKTLKVFYCSKRVPLYSEPNLNLSKV